MNFASNIFKGEFMQKCLAFEDEKLDELYLIKKELAELKESVRKINRSLQAKSSDHEKRITGLEYENESRKKITWQYGEDECLFIARTA